MSTQRRTAKSGVRAAIYTRISADRYGEAEGVERQKEACQKLATDRGLEVVAYFEDNNRSAMHGKRPAYEQLCAAVTRGEIDVVIVMRTDRLYRQLKDLVQLVDMFGRTPVYSVASGDVDLSTADGRMTANILGTMAQHESEVKAERISHAARQRTAKGRFSGGNRRFGYEHSTTRTRVIHKDGETIELQVPTGNLVLVPVEAEAIRWAYDAILRGVSINAVAREFNARGLTGARGARLSTMTIADILRRPMNAGLATYKGQVLEVAHEAPAIVSVDLWRQVVAILDDPKRNMLKRGRPPVSLLGPLLKCAVCIERGDDTWNARMTPKPRKDKQGNRRGRYACCATAGHVARSVPRLDAAISEIMISYLEGNADRLRRPVVKSSRVTKQEKRMAELEDKIAKWRLRAADMNPEDFIAVVDPMHVELEKLQKAHVLTSPTPATTELMQAEDLRATWVAMDVDAKRAVIRENVDRIEVGRGVIGSRDSTLVGVRIFDRIGQEIKIGTGGFDPDQPSEAHDYSKAMAESMLSMSDKQAERTSAALFPA